MRQTEQLIQERRQGDSAGGAGTRSKGTGQPLSGASGAGNPGGRNAGAAPVKDADTLALERDLSGLLGLQVTIALRGDGEEDERGSLTIHYDTLEQLDDVLRRLNHEPAPDEVSGVISGDALSAGR